MITHIRMKNFKSWLDSGNVGLAPLTGFFGTNSSGKSSLLQMLLLLKQTTECSDLAEVIFFGDENSPVNLGNFREVIHNHEQEAALGLEFRCELRNSLTIQIFQKISNYSLGGNDHPLKVDSFTFDAAIHENAGSLSVKHFSYTVGPDQKIEWREGILDYGEADKIKMSGVNIYKASVPESDKLLRPLVSTFEDVFSHIYYLGPTRVHPRRHYHWEMTHPKEIDMWGNKAVDALLSARVRQLTTAHNGENTSIEERISTWLQKMDLAYSFQLVPRGNLDDNNYEVRFRRSPSSAEVTLADMGHGVADLFPLLVHCCYIPEGSTLILEQPGIHLHPMAQADLADLLIEAIAERKLQILVESHSEHLLTRLQLGIAEDRKLRQDETSLYFCENEDGVSNIKPLGD